jgi:hypothetical protein
MFAMAVGQPREDCLDAVNVAWIRLVTPLDSDKNRSRWPTDLSWAVLQRASFADAPAPARRLIRRRQTVAHLQVLTDGVSGYTSSIIARAHPGGSRFDISMGIREVARLLIREFEKPDKDFGAIVREKRRRWGLALPPADKVLPFRSAFERDQAAPAALTLDAEPPENVSDQERAQWRFDLAVRRLGEAEQAHEWAKRQGRSPRILARLQADVEQEATTLAATAEKLC